MTKISPFALGATLYMPATREDLFDIVYGLKLDGLRSLVVCLEDAVSDTDIEQGLKNLAALLNAIETLGGRPSAGPLVFVRPRNAQMAATLNDWPLIGHIDGFVVPKLDLSSLPAWQAAVTRPGLMLMPTLETHEAFDPAAMVELREAMAGDFQQRVIALRIGGNDLMGCLGLRRSQSHTLYQSPMGYVIPMLAGVMGAAGFALTAPVFERLDNPALLAEELALDVAHGLVGKTAIHPTQIASIHEALMVSHDDLASAQRIVSEDAAAVFQLNGAMCEPATHLAWAKNTLERAHWHGVRSPSPLADTSLARRPAVVRPLRQVTA
jgi:citrate lyase beta subunit